MPYLRKRLRGTLQKVSLDGGAAGAQEGLCQNARKRPARQNSPAIIPAPRGGCLIQKSFGSSATTRAMDFLILSRIVAEAIVWKTLGEHENGRFS